MANSKNNKIVQYFIFWKYPNGSTIWSAMTCGILVKEHAVKLLEPMYRKQYHIPSNAIVKIEKVKL